MLIDAIESGDVNDALAPSAIRIHDLLMSARKVLRKSGAQGEDLLWEIWSNALTSNGEKLSESWRRQALRGGARGAAADRDLDAMMQLFETARRFAERFPHAKADSFIRQINQESILGDVITAKGQRPDVVEILTVHSAKGREWDVVAIAGLQDGAWPNLRQRGSLLGSERLVERIRHGAAPLRELDALAASGLVEDERRLIYVATTRARKQIIVTCVQKDDAEPSIYFEEIAEFLGAGSMESFTDVPRPLTANALVATLRGEVDGGQSEIATALLRRLADEGIEVADPNSWYGVLPISSDAPIVAPGKQVSVSPSSGESFTDCGLKWFLERSGGTDGDSTAQVLGSAIHAFAALMESDKSLTEEDLVEKLKNAWNLIDPNTGWVHATQLTKALEMIRKFVSYHTNSQNTVVGVEAKFVVDVGRAQVRGSADRLELTADGKLYVVDFKTGSVVPSAADALTNMQMQAYQLAITEGGFSNEHESRISAGAELVYLGSKTKKVSTRSQPPINVDEVKAEIEEIAEGMASNIFTASINDNCQRCAVRGSCPIQSDGRAVME
jgi:RecB family exonuclease